MPENDDLIVGSADDAATGLTNEQVLDKYGSELGGTKFNESGDLINDADVVIKSKDDLQTFLTEKSAAIINTDGDDDDEPKPNSNDESETKSVVNDVEYDLDKDGNALENGEIKYTADQLKEAAEDSETNDSNVSAIMEIVGFKPVNDQGEPIEYEQTVEGIAKYVNDVAATKGSEIARSQMDNYFKANPNILQAHLYQQQHGSLDGFGNTVDWKTVQLDEANEEQHVNIIVNAKMAEGLNANDAKRFAEFIKASGETKEEAIKSLTQLADFQSKQEEAAKLDMQRKFDAAKEQEAKYYEDVANIINKGELDDITIPEDIKGKFLDYYTKPAFQDDNGKVYTEYEAAKLKAGLTSNVKDALFMFMGKDLSTLIKAGVNKANVNKVRKLVIGNKAATSSTGGGNNRNVVL